MTKRVALAALLVACGRAPAAGVSSDSAATAPASQAAGAGPATNLKPACPANGQWALCAVEQRIRRAGLVARKLEAGPPPPLRAAFSVKPIVYALGRDSRLEIFLYPSAAALARDVSKMDTVNVAPPGRVETWGTPPILIRSVNLAAVLLTTDAREADRVYLALTAGPPSGGR
jgi:hypothetical protein